MLLAGHYSNFAGLKPFLDAARGLDLGEVTPHEAGAIPGRAVKRASVRGPHGLLGLSVVATIPATRARHTSELFDDVHGFGHEIECITFDGEGVSTPERVESLVIGSRFQAHFMDALVCMAGLPNVVSLWRRH